MGAHHLSNRVVMTPHLGRLAPGRFLDYLRERVPGGAALVVVPAGGPVYGASIYPDPVPHVPEGYQADQDAMLPGATHPGAQLLWRPTAAVLGEAAELVHAAGSLLVGQLHHPGAERSWDSFQPVLAPSAVDGEWPAQHPHVLTDDEVDRVVVDYVENARLIMAAGLDGVEVHAAHGYLLNRFLSPAYNHREGRYGGSDDARWRVLRTILEETRRAIGPAALLGVRLPAFEQVSGGLSVNQVAAGTAGCGEWLDYVNLTLGNHDGLAQGRPVLPYTTPWLGERPSLAAAGRSVKEASGLPVVVTGGVTSAADVEDALSAGADLVGVARAAIADPRFVSKVLEGRGDEVVPCIGCNECVLVPFACPANPRAGREREMSRPAADHRRRVLVVGGGIAGLSAAVAARERGHDVCLVEREVELGGRLTLLVRDPARLRFTGLLDSLTRRVSSGIDLQLGQELTTELVGEIGPDLLVVATGATIAPATFLSDGSLAVLTSDDVLAGARPPGEDVVVAAGSEPHVDPPLVARLLAEEGHRVRLVTTLPTLAPAVEQRTLNLLLDDLTGLRVEIRTSTSIAAATAGAVTLRALLGGARDEQVATSSVVLAHTRASDPRPVETARASGVPLVVIGDALAPRRLTHAALEGTRFGLSL